MNSPATIPELKEVIKNRGYDIQYENVDNIQVLLPSGYIIALGWGILNYCTRRIYAYPGGNPERVVYERLENVDAEIAVWTTQSYEFIRFEGWTGDVKGWVPVPEILRIIDYLAGVEVVSAIDAK